MIYKLATSMLMCSAASASFVGSAPMGAASGSRVVDDVRMSGVARNANIGKLQAGYLFPEIGRRRNEHMEANPDAEVISLGIGDTTMPIPDHILSGLVRLNACAVPSLQPRPPLTSHRHHATTTTAAVAATAVTTEGGRGQRAWCEGDVQRLRRGAR